MARNKQRGSHKDRTMTSDIGKVRAVLHRHLDGYRRDSEADWSIAVETAATAVLAREAAAVTRYPDNGYYDEAAKAFDALAKIVRAFDGYRASKEPFETTELAIDAARSIMEPQFRAALPTRNPRDEAPQDVTALEEMASLIRGLGYAESSVRSAVSFATAEFIFSGHPLASPSRNPGRTIGEEG